MSGEILRPAFLKAVVAGAVPGQLAPAQRKQRGQEDGEGDEGEQPDVEGRIAQLVEVSEQVGPQGELTGEAAHAVTQRFDPVFPGRSARGELFQEGAVPAEDLAGLHQDIGKNHGQNGELEGQADVGPLYKEHGDQGYIA
jgi:hypothetical protein